MVKGMKSYTLSFANSLSGSNPAYPRARAMLVAALLCASACDEAESTSTPELGFAAEHVTAQVNGVDIHYVIAGQGDPVVLLPGWPQTWYQWRHVMAALAQDYTVIAPDLRGMGDSSIPVGGYDKKTMAEDIHALVQDLGYSTIHLVGHDIGGMVAYAYASMYPDEVATVAFVDSPIPGELFYQLPALSPQGGIWWFGLHSVPEMPEELIAGREDVYLTWFFQNLAFRPEVFTEEVMKVYVEAASRPGAFAAGLNYYRTFPQDIEDNAVFAETQLTMPVLAVGGAMSTGDLIANMLQPLATDVTPAVIENSGHWVPEEQPEALVTELRALLSR